MSSNAKQGMSYFRIPPDGAGKHLLANVYWQVGYAAATGVFVVGDIVTGQTSLTVGEVNNYFPTDASTGIVGLSPQDGTGIAFTVGESLLVNGSPVATVASVTERYAQDMIVVGKNNARFGQHVDKDGSAFIRFTEGSQQLDVYGLSRMVQPTIISTMDFKYGVEFEDYHAVSGTSGTITHNSYQHAVILNATADSGSNASFRQSVRTPIFPGAGMLDQLAVVVGDAGKTDVVRRWGKFSNNNGYFFELSGTALSVVRRSNSTGATVDTKFTQASWNVDPLDGNGPSGMNLDVSKINIYWFNVQTFTAGRIRFGVINEQGERVVCHNEIEINSAAFPGTRNLTLPIRIDQYNAATTVSPSQIKLLAASSLLEGVRSIVEDTPSISRYSSLASSASSTITGTDWQPIGTFRSMSTFNGVDNYLITVPHIFTAYVSGSPIHIAAIKNATLNTSSFGPAGTNTGAEIENAATYMSGGRNISTFICDVGATEHHFDEHVWNIRGEAMAYKGSSIYGDTYTIAAKKVISGSADATVWTTFNWSDVG